MGDDAAFRFDSDSWSLFKLLRNGGESEILDPDSFASIVSYSVETTEEAAKWFGSSILADQFLRVSMKKKVEI